jgi:hypothetical protein
MSGQGLPPKDGAGCSAPLSGQRGFITAEQALAAAETRARPPHLYAIIATLPEEAALAARISWATMTEARRADPLFAALIASGHATANQVDDLFRMAARL